MVALSGLAVHTVVRRTTVSRMTNVERTWRVERLRAWEAPAAPTEPHRAPGEPTLAPGPATGPERGPASELGKMSHVAAECRSHATLSKGMTTSGAEPRSNRVQMTGLYDGTKFAMTVCMTALT